MASDKDFDGNLQDAIFENTSGGLLDAMAQRNPRLKDRIKSNERRRRFPQSERILTRLIAKDESFGERNRDKKTTIRLSDRIQARLRAFLTAANLPIERQRFVEVAIDELLDQLGEE